MGLISQLRRGRLTRRARDPRRYPDGPVRSLVAALPAADATPLAGAVLLAVDLETTGLSEGDDHILSVGWAPIDAAELRLGGAREVLVAPPSGVPVGESATIHGLTDDELAAAAPLDGVLPEVLAALQGRILVAHHARIETGFLAAAARRVWGCGLPLLAIDTLRLQHRLVADEHGQVPRGSLRLDAARSHFGLPRYRSHSAGLDALAAGELLLAQAAELSHRLGRPATVRDLGARLAR